MHDMQATKYFLGTSLQVKKLLPSDVVSGNLSSEFDLLFISIHAFKDLMDAQIPISFVSGISRIYLLMSITTYLENYSAIQTHGQLSETWQEIISKLHYYQLRQTINS